MTKKNEIVYITSTPRSLTRTANEVALRKFAEKNSKLIETLTKITKASKQYT